ncbi:MAG: hypothetical protein RID53_02770 [Coleofasciculus sp. B1-GNL1-01]|uniref:hypothetical protein n=1 Tax=Coleofasciculus sp. B1-GNL1-01 TaxID=3068484 RepID=UPI0033045AAF
MIHNDDQTQPQTRYTLIKIGAALSAIAAILAIWWAFRTPSESPVSPSNVSPASPSPPASPLTPELVPPPSASPALSGEPTNPENQN